MTRHKNRLIQIDQLENIGVWLSLAVSATLKSPRFMEDCLVIAIQTIFRLNNYIHFE